MKKRYLKQVLAAFLSFVMAVESPIYALADDTKPVLTSGEEAVYSSEISDTYGDMIEAEISDELPFDENKKGILTEDDTLSDGIGVCETISGDFVIDKENNDTLSDNSVSENTADISEEALIDEDMYYVDSNTETDEMPQLYEDQTLHELIQYRSENIKAYEKPDHSITVMYYDEPVNYRNEEGKWITIDNRLHYSEAVAEDGYEAYSNNAAPFDMRFAVTADEDSLFTIREGSKRVAFTYIPNNEQRLEGDERQETDQNPDASSDNGTEIYDDTLSENISVSGNISVSENISGTQISQVYESRTVSENDAVAGKRAGWSRKAVLMTADETAALGDRELITADRTVNADYDEEGSGEGEISYPELPQPQTVLYRSVDEGADLEYVPTGDGVKETIVIDSPEAPEVYTFRMKLEGMTALLRGEDVILSDGSGAEIYEIPAPVVIDANGADDCEAHYSIRSTGTGSYELKVTIDGEWLRAERRAFPVRIDPTIKKYRRFDSLDSLGSFVSVCSDGTTDRETLNIGRDKSKDGKLVTYRTYIGLKLPQIDKGSVVTDAKLRLKAEDSSEPFYIIPVQNERDAEKINSKNEPFKGSTIKKGLENISDFGKSGTAILDITRDVKAIADGRKQAYVWCLVSADETIRSEKKTVRKITPYKGTDKPFLEITYKDLTGTEDYYSVHRQSVGSAGIGSINDFTGRLTYVHTDATSAGERMPLSLSHVYDIAYGERMGEEKWMPSDNHRSGYGAHFRLSTDIRLLIPAGETDVKTYPYVYIDADGTKHYFKKANVIYYVNGSGKTASKDNQEYPAAKDEDGLGLFVVPVTENTLKNTYPLKIVNRSGSMSMYFDKNGYLWKISDSNLREDGKNGMNSNAKEKKQENAITINYENGSYDSSTELTRLKEITEEIKGLYDKEASQEEMSERIFSYISRLEEFEIGSLAVSARYKTALCLQNAKDNLRKIPDGDNRSNFKKDIDTAVKELEKAMNSGFDVVTKRPVKVTDAAGTSAELSYDADGMLISMSDPFEGGGLIRYKYDNIGNLIRIDHSNGTYAEYTYDLSGHLIKAVDERGYRIDYAYGDNKKTTDQVTKVAEYVGNKAGQTILISHDEINTAVYTYSGNDEKTGNKDDIENVYCFDDKGRTTGAYSRKKNTKEVLGGKVRTYTEDDSDTTSCANKIKEEAITGSQVINLVTDGSFEKTKSKNGEEAWSAFNTCEDTKNCHAVKKDTSQKYMGDKSAYVKLKDGHAGEAGYRQTITVPEKGQYTASVYVHTKNLNNARAKLSIKTRKKTALSAEGHNSESEGSEESGSGDDGSGDDEGSGEEGSETEESGRVEYDTLPDINNGWKRIEATINAKTGEDLTISVSLEGTSGEAWFDCAQLEKGSLSNQYNLISNSGFEEGFRVNPNLTVLPSGWAYGAEAVEEKEVITYDDETDAESKSDADDSCVNIVKANKIGTAAVEGNSALMIKGNPSGRRSIIVNPNFGSEKASYSFSCYVKADCTPVPLKDSKRKCGIYIRGNKAGYNEDDASGKYVSISGSDEAKALINTQTDGWQYVSIALPVKNWHGRLIEIRFDYECGTLCIDGCMLTKNEVQTKTYTASGKLKTEQKGELTKTYDTDGRSRRKKETLPGGASTSYTYDNITNDVKSEKYSFKQPGKDSANSLTTKYTYDEYGNVSEINETAGGVTGEIKTETGYDDKGRFAVSDTDSRGNTTESRYDENNGLLLGMTDVLGIETGYTYNGYHDPTGVSSAGANVSYTYDKKYHDRLKTIKAVDDKAEEAYTFTYDAYGNVKAVSRSGSDKRLISYAYMSNNGKLKQKAYGNGNKVTYKYNDLEQLISESYGGKDVISYEYDNRGNTARITDKKEGLKYRCYYDDKGRITTAEVSRLDGKEYKEEIAFQSIYDKAGRQSVFAYYTDGQAYRTEYGYTSDDKAAAATLPSGGVFKRTYDGFERITKDEFTPQKKPETGEKKARGNGAAVSSTYSYLGTDRGEESDKTKYTTRFLEKLDTTVGTGKNKKTAVNDTLSYDKAGRIDSFNGIVYTYDDLGRLIKANDEKNDRIWEYSYDKLGNLIGSSYTENGEKKEDTYGYSKGNLTEFGGEKIRNYRGGNPGVYLGNTLKWERGRQLKSIKAGRKSDKQSAEYTYAYDGTRLSKTVGKTLINKGTKTEYILNGSMILQERIKSSGEEEVLNYYYSPDGKLLEIGYRKGDEKEDHYSVIRNALGDVVALYTAEGTLVGTYEYDPYGKLISETKNPAYDDTDGILAKNPFRYRGYYYDRETGWYYLQSRYYDPEVKRFINADSTDLLTNDCDNMMQYNLFMYCNGDPVNGVDPSGCDCLFEQEIISMIYMAVLEGLIDGVVTITTTCINTGMDFETLNANRNMFNRVPDDLSEVKNTWIEVNGIESIFHLNKKDIQKNDASYNKKYIHINPDGSSYEAIICSPPYKEEYLVLEGKNRGTYNFCSPVNEISLRWISSRAAHLVADVIPFYIWENNK